MRLDLLILCLNNRGNVPLLSHSIAVLRVFGHPHVYLVLSILPSCLGRSITLYGSSSWNYVFSVSVECRWCHLLHQDQTHDKPNMVVVVVCSSLLADSSYRFRSDLHVNSNQASPFVSRVTAIKLLSARAWDIV